MDKFKGMLRDGDIVYFITMFAFAVITYVIAPMLATAEFVAIISVMTVIVVSRYKHAKKMTKYIENNVHIDDMSRNYIALFPYPMAIVRLDGSIVWYNNMFNEQIESGELYGKYISSISVSIRLSESVNIVEIKDKWYEIRSEAVESNTEYLLSMYFFEITELVEKRNAEAVVAAIFIDNYEEAIERSDDKAQLGVTIDKLIYNWAEELKGILKKIDQTHYFMVITNESLNLCIEKKFPILEAVKQIANKIPITLSIGIGIEGDNLREKEQFARTALDMALGRGGDQVVLRSKEDFKYFGGKSKEVEKKTKVRARVVANALAGIISQADRVIIMGHKILDMDGIGAALGIAACAMSKGKEAHIVLGKYDDTVGNLIDRMRGKRIFIKKQQARSMLTLQTLLVIVDTNSHSLVEDNELLEMTNNVVVIDHHRKGAKSIEKAVLSYVAGYASSTCELVTEIILYMDNIAYLSKETKSALYAGIVVDTKNFSFKTGVRTLEAAALLRSSGVDPTDVRHLLQNDFSDVIKKADILKSSWIYRGNIAISAVVEEAHNSVLIAQAADELLSIKGIEASFVVSEYGTEIAISGRSMGEINVQVILEKLGGGGHMLVAGAQLKGTDLDKAVELLTTAIDEVL